MKYKESATVVEQKKIAAKIYSLWIQAGRIAGEAKPGQFLSLYSKDESRMLPRAKRAAFPIRFSAVVRKSP